MLSVLKYILIIRKLNLIKSMNNDAYNIVIDVDWILYTHFVCTRVIFII